MWIAIGCLVGFYALMVIYLVAAVCFKEDTTTQEENDEQARIISHGN